MQENISVFVLDQRDEIPNDSGRYWKHSASLKKRWVCNIICFSDGAKSGSGLYRQ